MTTLFIQDAHDAIDIAQMLAEGGAKRNFLATGELTPGFRAAVELQRDFSVRHEDLALYVEARVAARDLGAPADWPR